LKKQAIVIDGDILEESIKNIKTDDEDDFLEKNILYTGFLKSNNKSEEPWNSDYQFPHLTFQEYFAALYVSKLSKEEISEVIRGYKLYPYMQVFFTFLGGLIKDKEFLLEQIKNEPKDVFKFYELLLILDIVREVKSNDINHKKIFKIAIWWLKFLMKGEDENYQFIIGKLKVIDIFENDKNTRKLVKIASNKSILYIYRIDLVVSLIFIKKRDYSTIRLLINILFNLDVNLIVLMPIKQKIEVKKIIVDFLYKSSNTLSEFERVQLLATSKLLMDIDHVDISNYGKSFKLVINEMIDEEKFFELEIIDDSLELEIIDDFNDEKFLTLIKYKNINLKTYNKNSKLFIFIEKNYELIVNSFISYIKDINNPYDLRYLVAQSLAILYENDYRIIEAIIDIVQQDSSICVFINIHINVANSYLDAKVVKSSDYHCSNSITYLPSLDSEWGKYTTLVNSSKPVKSIVRDYITNYDKLSVPKLLFILDRNDSKYIETLLYLIKSGSIHPTFSLAIIHYLASIDNINDYDISMLLDCIQGFDDYKFDLEHKKSIIKLLVVNNTINKSIIFDYLKDMSLDISIREVIAESLVSIVNKIKDKDILILLDFLLRVQGPDLLESLINLLIGVGKEYIISNALKYLLQDKLTRVTRVEILNLIILYSITNNGDVKNYFIHLIKNEDNKNIELFSKELAACVLAEYAEKNNILKELDIRNYFPEIFIENATVKSFFVAYNNDYINLEMLIRNIFHKKLPIFIKDNKLFTIYKNQELQTQRKVCLEDIEKVKRKINVPSSKVLKYI